MPRTASALINPAMLAWARDAAGLSIPEAAKKAHVAAHRYAEWEDGAATPTIAQLRALATAFKRPLAVFYLYEVPASFQPLRDFRRFPPEHAVSPTAHLRQEIDRARYRREIALDLLQTLGEEPAIVGLSLQRSGDTELAGNEVRNFLGITREQQRQWHSPYDALNTWRAAIESRGLLTFQFSGVEPAEARAFSISEEPLPVLAVNIKDSPRARVFSFIHELTHIGLRDGGLCDLRDDSAPGSAATRVEIYCNRVAGAAIIPMQDLLEDETVTANAEDVTWSDQEIDTLSRRFSASWETVLRRLLIAGRTSEEFYRRKRRELLERYSARTKPKEGFASPSVLAVATAGPQFVRLALSSYYQERITASDLSEFLGVRLKHMPGIEQAVLGHSVEFGPGP